VPNPLECSLSIIPLTGIGEIQPGDNLAQLLGEALRRAGIAIVPFDVLVVAQKVVSKAENRFVDLNEVRPSPEAIRLAAVTRKDPRLVELVLGESTEVLRSKPDVLIVRHRMGYVMANAGIDRSNVGGADRVLLLPENPDASAGALRSSLATLLGTEMGIVICDSFGRPWRKGVTNVALGSAGLPALIDRRGESDRNGRRLEVTEVAFADLIASAAGLVMGEGAEGVPAALLRGLAWTASDRSASSLIRPLAEDLFR
jgi:coenzyme F420-0:L-glutamate ligase / coenzyme F420-1:gamma-L-glutamate ligase